MWKTELSLRYFPCTSTPVSVTSLMFPWSTSVMNCEKLISFSFWPPPPIFTTCHNTMADSRITSQNTTVLTVEFT